MERDLKNLEKEYKVKNLRDLWVGVLLYIIGVITIVGGLFLYLFILRLFLRYGYSELILLVLEISGLFLLIIGMIYPYRNRIHRRSIVCLFVILILPLSYMGFYLMIFMLDIIGLMLFIGIAVLVLILFIAANL